MGEETGMSVSGSVAGEMGAVLLAAAGIRDDEPASDGEAGGQETEPPVLGENGAAQAPESGDLADLLAQMTAGEQETDKPAEGGRDAPSDSLTLDAVAEKLGIDAAELYDVEIPMPDGEETLKLSELKDMATQYSRQEADRLEWDTETQRQRQEVATGRMELSHMLEMIPANLRTPQMLQEARQQLSTLRASEAKLLLDRVPEWKDSKVFEADQELIVSHLAPFGFTKEDWGTVVDHRLQAYARQNAKFMQRVGEITAKAKSSRTNRAASKTGGATATGRKTMPASGSRENKHAALGQALLEGLG